MMHQREQQLPPPEPATLPSMPGEAELKRYERILSKHKIEQDVLHELLEQRRTRRQWGWPHPRDDA